MVSSSAGCFCIIFLNFPVPLGVDQNLILNVHGCRSQRAHRMACFKLFGRSSKASLITKVTKTGSVLYHQHWLRDRPQNRCAQEGEGGPGRHDQKSSEKLSQHQRRPPSISQSSEVMSSSIIRFHRVVRQPARAQRSRQQPLSASGHVLLLRGDELHPAFQ